MLQGLMLNFIHNHFDPTIVVSRIHANIGRDLSVQVLELDGQNVKALYRRAQAYIQLVDLDLADIDIKRALEIDPDNR